MFIRSTVFALLVTALPALAEPVNEIQTCHLEGRIRLQAATQIFCGGDMLIEDGTEIIRDGHELQLWVTGKAYFGGSSSGFQIRAYDEASLNTDELSGSGSVLIYALTASGYLQIDSEGDDVGGDIELEYGSTIDYDHQLFTGRAASAEFIRNGEFVALSGPDHKPLN